MWARGGISRRWCRVQIVIAVAVAVLGGGCAAGQAFRHGASAARGGDWDAAVEYYRRALQEDPGRIEYRIALQRAMLNAARYHADVAAELEALGDLAGALREYRRAHDLDPSNTPAGVKIANLQQTLREQIEGARSPAPIQAMREQARRDMRPPLLDPASDEPLAIAFADTSLRDILNFLGDASGINITYDDQFEDASYSVELTGVTFQEALVRILSANAAFYKVVNPTTIVVVPDTPQKRADYAEQVIRTFYVSHGNVEELVELLRAIVSTPQMPVQPQFFGNAAANTITVRATAPVVGIIEQVIASNDKPRAEIIIDVEILEVNRERAKQYGLDLSRYSLATTFSPGGAPGADHHRCPRRQHRDDADDQRLRPVGRDPDGHARHDAADRHLRDGDVGRDESPGTRSRHVPAGAQPQHGRRGGRLLPNGRRHRTAGTGRTAGACSALGLRRDGGHDGRPGRSRCGSEAGNNNLTGDSNVYIANAGADGDSGVIRIGTEGVHTTTVLTGRVEGNIVAVYQ